MKNKLYYEDIICARATPNGSSAIGIIRISGKNSWQILKNIFIPKKKNIKYKSHNFYYGNIKDNDNQIVDDVVVLLYAEGNSFTGEESFEINCHGSEVIISIIIKILIDSGVRLAEPGEFSKRAFLNNRLDLTKAEAIMDIVNASTKKSALVAARQLSGRLSSEINEVKEKVSELLAEIEVNIDYPEEDISPDIEKWDKQIIAIITKIETLLSGFKRGKYYREGIHSVILGKTNSGKSTLFNFFINEDKAIVSDIHGTTRDFIDGMINIEGIGVRIYDTAGLRQSDDPIEIEGTKRAITLSENANIIIYTVSIENNFTSDDMDNLGKIHKEKKILFIINKVDLKKSSIDATINEIKKFAEKNQLEYEIVKMSATNKIGLNEFNSAMLKLATDDDVSDHKDPLLTNVRHATLLEDTYKNLKNSNKTIKDGFLDLTAFELRESLDKLGELTGEVTPSDILDKIFSTFCVGK